MKPLTNEEINQITWPPHIDVHLSGVFHDESGTPKQYDYHVEELATPRGTSYQQVWRRYVIKVVYNKGVWSRTRISTTLPAFNGAPPRKPMMLARTIVYPAQGPSVTLMALLQHLAATFSGGPSPLPFTSLHYVGQQYPQGPGWCITVIDVRPNGDTMIVKLEDKMERPQRGQFDIGSYYQGQQEQLDSPPWHC